MTTLDTICAPATVAGTGAITVIRVSGPDALGITDKVVTFASGNAAEASGYTIRYGSVQSPDGVLDDVLVSIFRAPHSYTGEDGVEISCHASSYIAGRILEMLVAAGCRMAEPGEFTRRAFVNGKMDLAQAEAVADVIASSSRAAHRVAMNQLKGGYSSELRRLREALVELTALMELELDFSEEDVEFADRDRLRALLADTSAHISRLASSFRAGNAVKNGVPVAIVGAVNAGKSTLLNALLGEDRAIVSDIAGTTRDTVEETMVLDGVLYRFIDTAGIRSTADTVEALGVKRSLDALAKADIVIEVVDGVSPAAESVAADIAEWQTHIVAVNKCDIAGSDEAGGVDVDGSGVVRISAKTGQGLEALRAAISAAGRERVGHGEETLVTNLRHFEALTRSGQALGRVSDGLASGIPTDLVAQDLREALFHLGTILGEVSTDEVLGEIFGKFCIGK